MSGQKAGKPNMRPTAVAAKEVANQNQQPSVITQTQTQVYQGPVPHPDILAGFEKLAPGSARELIDMAKAESRHRQEVEMLATNANIEAQRRQITLSEYQSKAVFRSDSLGQIFGLIVSLCCVGGAVYLAIDGHEVVATALVAMPTAAVIQAFFAKRKDSK